MKTFNTVFLWTKKDKFDYEAFSLLAMAPSGKGVVVFGLFEFDFIVCFSQVNQ